MAVRARAAGATVRAVHTRCQRHAAVTVGRSRDVRACGGRQRHRTQAHTQTTIDSYMIQHCFLVRPYLYVFISPSPSRSLWVLGELAADGDTDAIAAPMGEAVFVGQFLENT